MVGEQHEVPSAVVHQLLVISLLIFLDLLHQVTPVPQLVPTIGNIESIGGKKPFLQLPIKYHFYFMTWDVAPDAKLSDGLLVLLAA